MHCKFWAAGLLLALSGCDLSQPSSAPVYGYAPGYAPDYPPEYYSPPEYPPSAVYPGYSYDGGVPTIIEGGAAMPLVFFGGEWGYFDHHRHFHRAPDPVSRDLERRRFANPNFRPGAIPPPGRPPPAPQPPPQQHPFFGGPGPAGFHPAPPPPSPAPPPRPFFGGGGAPPASHAPPAPSPAPAAPAPAQKHPFFGG